MHTNLIISFFTKDMILYSTVPQRWNRYVSDTCWGLLVSFMLKASMEYKILLILTNILFSLNVFIDVLIFFKSDFYICIRRFECYKVNQIDFFQNVNWIIYQYRGVFLVFFIDFLFSFVGYFVIQMFDLYVFVSWACHGSAVPLAFLYSFTNS